MQCIGSCKSNYHTITTMTTPHDDKDIESLKFKYQWRSRTYWRWKLNMDILPSSYTKPVHPSWYYKNTSKWCKTIQYNTNSRKKKTNSKMYSNKNKIYTKKLLSNNFFCTEWNFDRCELYFFSFLHWIIISCLQQMLSYINTIHW